jgi:hypothetical protein
MQVGCIVAHFWRTGLMQMTGLDMSTAGCLLGMLRALPCSRSGADAASRKPPSPWPPAPCPLSCPHACGQLRMLMNCPDPKQGFAEFLTTIQSLTRPTIALSSSASKGAHSVCEGLEFLLSGMRFGRSTLGWPPRFKNSASLEHLDYLLLQVCLWLTFEPTGGKLARAEPRVRRAF